MVKTIREKLDAQMKTKLLVVVEYNHNKSISIYMMVKIFSFIYKN